MERNLRYEEWFERGHVAIVTGASKGFGRAVARELARLGLRLVIDARGADLLRQAEDELAALTDVIAIAGDVADNEHVHRLIAAAEQRFGRLDLVVNNASSLGRTPLPPVAQISPATLDRLVGVNLAAPLHVMQHAIPLLARDGGGTIVNVSSDAAVEAYEGWGGYGATKAALDHLSQVLALELHGTDVSVLVVDPGDMATDLHAAAVPDADLSQLRDPREMAPALLAAIAAPRPQYARVALAPLPVRA